MKKSKVFALAGVSLLAATFLAHVLDQKKASLHQEKIKHMAMFIMTIQ